jgi:periplasmic divalent cation tolerance protein
MSLMLVYTTVSTAQDARRLADVLVGEGLCACAQSNAIHSTYVWEGALAHDYEHRVLFKTHRALHDDLVARLRELHPYTLPAIYSLQADHVDAKFQQWVESD